MKEVPDLNSHRVTLIGRFISWLTSRRIMRRVLLSLAIVITLIAIIYARVNRRGDRLLEDARHELEARGEVLDWSAYIPPPVPDDQNILKAPKMAEWFRDNRTIANAPLDHPVTNDFARRLQSSDSDQEITNPAQAAKYLAWSDQFQSDFDTVDEALKRPYARTVADYSKPLSLQFPNAATCGAVARTLEQRAKCHLLVSEPDKAWEDLGLLHDLSRLIECQGKFITPEGAWMVRSGTRCSLSAIAKGLELHGWSDSQLSAFEGQLADTDCVARFTDALRCGRAGLLASVENGTFLKVRGERSTKAVLLSLAPHGVITGFFSKQLGDWQGMIDVLGPSNGVIHPADAYQAFSHWKRAQEGLPNLLRDQAWIHEGQIACALERYRLAHGGYPENLESLVPQFIAKLPRDIINGEPLKYQRKADGGFLLYSVGWKETDDHGQSVSNPRTREGQIGGDWAWSDISKF